MVPSNTATARVACIDIGTNSVLLLIAEKRGTELVALEERATITRLGEGVDKARVLLPHACDRTLQCLREYQASIDRWQVGSVVAVGTSAMRDAAGGDAFRARAAEILGVEPRVISGNEEAELTFEGALSGLGVHDSVIVFDVGGGSTEIIQGRVGNELQASREITSKSSLDVGSVRLYERFMTNDPPTPAECAEVERTVQRELEALGPAPTSDTLVGVAGTVTTLAAVEQQLEPYVGSRVHGCTLSKSSVDTLVKQLARLPVRERAKIPGLAPQRADVIVAGALLVRAVMSWAHADSLLVSDRGVRWGLAERALRAR